MSIIKMAQPLILNVDMVVMQQRLRVLLVTVFFGLIPVSHAQDPTQAIEDYLVNFKDESGYQPLVSGLKFEFERLQHNKKKEPEYDWAVAVAMEANGRYAVGFGKNYPTGAHPSKHAKRFCNQQRKIRSMKVKCRSFAFNDRIQKPYKR